MYTPFNHNFIIILAIMNNLQKFLTFLGKKVYLIKCAYLNFGGQVRWLNFGGLNIN